MGVDCEKRLPNGDLCGIQAIGRCAICGESFCLSHQAWSEGTSYFGATPYIDRCAPCLAKARADEVKHVREALVRIDEAREYFRSGSVRTALLTSRVPPVTVYHVEERFEGGRYFRRERLVKKVISEGHGWILGEFNWRYTCSDHHGHEEHSTRSCLTALLDVDSSQLPVAQLNQWNRQWLDEPGQDHLLLVHHLSWLGRPEIDQDHRQPLFTPVKPYSDGFEYSGWRYLDPEGHTTDSEVAVGLAHSWVELAQAVRRLTGVSS